MAQSINLILTFRPCIYVFKAIYKGGWDVMQKSRQIESALNETIKTLQLAWWELDLWP